MKEKIIENYEKKLFHYIFILIIILISLLPFSIKADVYNVYDMIFEFEKNNWDVITNYNFKNKNLKQEAAKIINDFFKKEGYLYAYDYNGENTITIYIHDYEGIKNLKNQDEEVISSIKNKLSKEYNTNKIDIHETENYKYIYIESNDNTQKNESFICYFTIINNRTYTIMFAKYNNKNFTNNDKETIKNTINSIAYKGLKEKYKIFDLNITLNQKGWEYIEKSDIDNDEKFENIRKTINDESVYLFSRNPKENKEFIIIVEKIWDIDNLKKEKNEIVNIYENDLANAYNAFNHEIFENEKYKYINIEFIDKRDYNVIHYYTTINKNTYTLRFRKDTTFTDNEKNDIKDLVNSITFDENEKNIYNVNSYYKNNNSMNVFYIAFTIFATLILFSIIFKLKKNKKNTN